MNLHNCTNCSIIIISKYISLHQNHRSFTESIIDGIELLMFTEMGLDSHENYAEENTAYRKNVQTSRDDRFRCSLSSVRLACPSTLKYK